MYMGTLRDSRTGSKQRSSIGNEDRKAKNFLTCLISSYLMTKD